MAFMVRVGESGGGEACGGAASGWDYRFEAQARLLYPARGVSSFWVEGGEKEDVTTRPQPFRAMAKRKERGLVNYPPLR